MSVFQDAEYKIVYEYKVQTVWDELIKLSGLPTLLFYLFKFCLGQYQLHIADIDMVEDIERMGKERLEKNGRNGHSRDHSSPSRPVPKRNNRNRAISQMYEHGHFNFLKMYLLQDN